MRENRNTSRECIREIASGALNLNTEVAALSPMSSDSSSDPCF